MLPLYYPHLAGLVLHSITSHKEITHNEASNNDASHNKNIYQVTIFINDTIHRVVCHNSKHKGRCSSFYNALFPKHEYRHLITCVFKTSVIMTSVFITSDVMTNA